MNLDPSFSGNTVDFSDKFSIINCSEDYNFDSHTMELRGCSMCHYIKVIRHGLVMKVHNVDFRGRLGIKTRKLESIIGDPDAQDTLKFTDNHDSSEVDCEKETESPCLPFAERKTRKRGTESDRHHNNRQDGGEESDELSFEEITLSQLKEKCKKNKRKALELSPLSPKPECICPEDDDIDLNESLSSWKAKHSKSPKYKNKHARKSIFPTYDIDISVKPEQISDTENALQSGGLYFGAITIKIETPETEQIECRNSITQDGVSLPCIEQGGICDGESGFRTIDCEGESGELIPFTQQGKICVVDDFLHHHLNEHTKPSSLLPAVSEDIILFDDQVKVVKQSLVLPVSELMREECSNSSPSNLSSLEFGSPAKEHNRNTCDSPLTYPDQQVVSPAKDQDYGALCTMTGNFGSTHISHSCSSLDTELAFVLDHSIASAESQLSSLPGCTEERGLLSLDDSVVMLEDLSIDEVKPPLPTVSVDAKGISSGHNHPCDIVHEGSVPEIRDYHDVEQQQPAEMLPLAGKVLPHLPRWDHSPASAESQLSSAPSATEERGFLSSNGYDIMLEDSSMDEVKQPLPSVNGDADGISPGHNHPCDIIYEHPVPDIRKYHHIEQQQTPERLHSARKVISPTSQEKLCLALRSAESPDEIDQYTCKEKLYFGGEAESKTLSNGLYVEGKKMCMQSVGTEQIIQNKVTNNPRQILKKPKNEKKGSPPKKSPPSKGCLDGPRLCRSLPHLSTGCTSIQACSESAIAFSQRQMRDIESLALKLMAELNTMKGIVEEKLPYEAYRSTSVKNEDEEMRSAIKTATKTEEIARRWLSMMARDCNRFCKIMKLTEDNAPVPENSIHENASHRERKKISFADEAGGVLCDVKFFENGLASVESSESRNN